MSPFFRIDMISILKNECDDGQKMNKIRKRSLVNDAGNKGCTQKRNGVKFTDFNHFAPASISQTQQTTGENDRTDTRSYTEKVFFPVRVLGWTFDKSETSKMIRFNSQYDAILDLHAEYDDHDHFLTECMNKGVEIRARDHNWSKLSYDFRDYAYLENTNFKNRDNRLQVQVIIPKNVNFLLDAEILVKSGADAEYFSETDEKTKFIHCKINAIRDETMKEAKIIQNASEFMEIFNILTNLFEAYELNIFEHILGIKCG